MWEYCIGRMHAHSPTGREDTDENEAEEQVHVPGEPMLHPGRLSFLFFAVWPIVLDHVKESGERCSILLSLVVVQNLGGACAQPRRVQ